ncbi:MAG: hypothetical protein HC810_08310 [Acaryochloridaceae cyanobacterium RL_2_7]|nr:hypothetical protein [Acaryochloridaceae cyanobacterium RL_2_7]
MSIYTFSQATQFTLDRGLISLIHGDDYIAQGSFGEWVQCFEALSLEVSTPLSIAPSIALQPHQQSCAVYDATQSDPHRLILEVEALEEFEARLEIIHQGCCEPQPFNLVAEICDSPDTVLQLLQDVTHYPLSAKQVIIAKRVFKDMAY